MTSSPRTRLDRSRRRPSAESKETIQRTQRRHHRESPKPQMPYTFSSGRFGHPATARPPIGGVHMKPLVYVVAITALTSLASVANADVPVPAPGASPRVDAIKKAGTLRVGVLANAPWLVENTTGQGEAWSGPAWILAQEYAKRLNVKLEPVPVSHETKVPVLASNQVDISVTPLAETQERLKVVDFIIYSNTSVCVFGLASNPRLAQAKSVDDLNKPDITIAY